MQAIYKAKDDSEHDSPAAAKKRDALIQASEELEAAGKKVQRLLGESAKTADGHWFNMSHSGDYWVIRPNFSGLPRLQQISIWPYDLHVDLDRRDARLVVRSYERDGSCTGRYIEWKVCELYSEERAAKKALVKACKARMAELQEEVDKITE